MRLKGGRGGGGKKEKKKKQAREGAGDRTPASDQNRSVPKWAVEGKHREKAASW